MDLRTLIERIAKEYDPKLGFQSEAQRLLRTAADVVGPVLPPGYVPVGSGGKGVTAFVPWISIFDPDETSSAQRGMYVVYLFAIGLGTVVLSLNQGATDVVERYKVAEGRRRLAVEAATIRDHLPPEAIGDLAAEIALPRTAARPVHYTYGNIIAKTYDAAALPNNTVMVGDLRRFLSVYETALEVRERLRRSTRDTITTTAADPDAGKREPFIPEFKPKDDADYHAQIVGQRLRKTRKHETLVARYGSFLKDQGFQPATNVHPRDMTASKSGDTWLIEAKMVHRGDGMGAAREALGQLLAYRHLHHRDQPVRMVALFSESVGLLPVELLGVHQISAVWAESGQWVGSNQAYLDQLCQTSVGLS